MYSRKSGTFALLYAKINVKSNHFLFLTSLESPLNKGGSEGVWKYRWLQHTLDLAKETAQTCMEQQIAYSAFDEKQKQEMKENLHEWADKVMQGFKKRLRESGRLIES